MADKTTAPFDALASLIASDPEYAWAWHCNIAMPIMDASGCHLAMANTAAANVMWTLFRHDITTHPHFADTGGWKSNAQAHRRAAQGAKDRPRGR